MNIERECLTVLNHDFEHKLKYELIAIRRMCEEAICKFVMRSK